ncbi:HLJ1_G0005180.mRNA.1.CDS.1 [Saccharomyces cerevisiae]|nr:HLJ1_G0005180.mRNA.1.CDS.1 [Saccharomyces cerevisiae]
MESIFLHNNITIISAFVLYVSLSYYIINPCISAFIRFYDYFSTFMSSSYTAYDSILAI